MILLLLLKLLDINDIDLMNIAEDLIMRRGVILEGAARRGHPARAKVLDQHKQAHYVMVEPHNDDDIIAQGETAMLVRKEGTIFFGLPDVHPTLRPI